LSVDLPVEILTPRLVDAVQLCLAPCYRTQRVFPVPGERKLGTCSPAVVLRRVTTPKVGVLFLMIEAFE